VLPGSAEQGRRGAVILSALPAQPAPRLYFVDNLRYLCVWCVVLFHASVGYIGLPEFFVEPQTTHALMPLRRVLALFTLPLLLLLAGYFTLPSLRHHGAGSFVRQRLLRLGLPFLVGIVFLGPLMPYLGYYAQSFRGLPSASYWDFWRGYVASGFSHWTLPVVFTTHPLFHHQHFYFLAFLLEILLGFLLLRALWGRVSPRRTSEAAPAARPGFTLTFLATAIGIALLHDLASRVPGSSEVVAFLFYFSLSDLILFGAAFGLGVHAYSRGWFRDGYVPGWQLLAVLSVTALFFHRGHELLHAHRGAVSPEILGLGRNLATSLGTWLAVAVVLVLGLRLLNRPGRFHSEMSASSYDIYLLQYPVILGLRLPLITWVAPAWIKFAIVVPLAIAICWAVSRFLIRPRPRTALVLLLVLHAGLCAMGLPRWGDSHLLLDRRAELTAVVPRPEGAELAPLDDPAALRLRSEAPAAPIPWGEGALSPLYLASTASGGLFFTASSEAGALYFRGEDGTLSRLALDPSTGEPHGLAFSSDGRTLFLNEAKGSTVWALDLRPGEGEGVAAQARPFAELFRGDRRYGTPQQSTATASAEAMAVDRDGHLYVATRLGVQVFSPTGRLLGLVTFPDLESHYYYPPQPTRLGFGGPGGRRLYVTCGDRVYVVETRS
jgi:Acyltransferase family/SMP-30/Gluconolactonase/LRE-like region